MSNLVNFYKEQQKMNVPVILSIDSTATTDEQLLIRSALPQGLDQPDLIAAAIRDVVDMGDQLHGKHILINGPCTTGMALALGHKLAHISKSVSIYDPKLAAFVLAVTH
jgi:hypothetical protein